MKEILPCEIKENIVKLISKDWALLSAGDEKSWNTMTVSWGMMGELWGRDVVSVFVMIIKMRLKSAVQYPAEILIKPHQRDLRLCLINHRFILNRLSL